MGTKNCSEYTTHASVPPSVRPSRDSQCVIHRRQNRIRGSSGRFLPQKSILEVNSNVWPKFVEFGQRNGEGMAGQKARLAFDELAAVAPCCGSWSSCVRVCVYLQANRQGTEGGHAIRIVHRTAEQAVIGDPQTSRKSPSPPLQQPKVSEAITSASA